MRFVVAVAVLIGALGMDASAFLSGDGKGKPDRDCYIGLEGYSEEDLSPINKKGTKRGVVCTECDPACDLDGVQNGVCRFRVAACVNQPDEACDPTSRTPKKIKAFAKAKGTGKIELGAGLPNDASSACGGFVEFDVPTKKNGKKAGKGKVTLIATKPADKDKFTFVCEPLPEGQSCPAPSTTTTTTLPGSTTTTTIDGSTTTTTTLMTTTSTSLPGTTTSTSLPGTTTSTSLPGSTTSTTVVSTTTTTSTTIAGTTTTTSTTVETTSTSTTTVTTSTTSTTMVQSFVYSVTTQPGGGACGQIRDDAGGGGSQLATLTCSGLNIGGGAATVPEGPTPDGATNIFNASCAGDTCTLSSASSGDTGSNLNCTDVGCKFGTYLSIANGPLSTCVDNSFQTAGSGTLNTATGEVSASVPLLSVVTVSGNDAEPCPPCSSGTCDASAANPGASCTAVNASGDNYECQPAGSTLPGFGVDLTPAQTQTVTASDAGGLFCPGQTTAGCFAEAGCRYIEANGSPAGAVTAGVPHELTLASVFCIPKTGNLLVDGAANLPGPGEVTLPMEGLLAP